MHGLDALDREVDQQRACEIEQRKEIEIRRKAQALSNRRRNEAPDKVACDIPGDVSGERVASIHRAALLAQIGKRQGKGRGHANALHDTKRGEDDKIWRNRKEAYRDREEKEARQNTRPAIDVRAEGSDH